MKRRNLIAIFLVGAVILAAALIAPVLGSPGGVNNRNLQASSCNAHDIASSNTVTATASKLDPAPGEQITVTVSVSGSGSGNKMGVALFTALSGSSGTAPVDKGWTIVSDPSGTKFNYNEKSYSSSATFTWTLNAPSTAGTYTLYARAFMGPTFNYKDAASSLKFTVANAQVINPPTVAISAPSSGAAVSGTFTVTASATPGTGATVSSVALGIDGASVGTKTASPYSWSVNSASYTNGAHTLSITATDNGGRTGNAQVTVTVNNMAAQPPAVEITSPSSGDTLTGMATVSATATPSGTATVTSVALSIDGTAVGSMTASPYSWSVNTAAYVKGTHTILVTATDSNGLKGTAQMSVSVNNDPASVSITSPTNGATVSGTVPVTATGTPPAGQTLTGMELRVDGVSMGVVSSAPFTWSVNTNDLANGQHIYNVTSTSSGGSRSYSQISVTYSNQPISVTIGAPTNGATLSGTVSVTATIASGQTVTFGTLTVDGTLFDNRTAAPFTWSLNTLTLANGQHTLLVTGGDSAGRVTGQQISVNVNNAPALVSITAPTNGAIVKGAMTVTASASSSTAVSWVRLTMDGTLIGNRTAAPYSWSIGSTGYADGQHTLLAEMMDSLGRKASQQVTVTFNNTGTAVSVPAVSVTSPANGASLSGTVTVNAQVTSSTTISFAVLRIDGVIIDIRTAAPYSWSLNTVNFVDGAHALNVSATDVKGKAGYNLITVQTVNPPPSVLITSPTNGQSLVRTFGVNATVTAQSIGYVTLTLDGTVIGNKTAAPYSWSWDSFNLKNGAHNLVVTAVDGNGKRGSQSISVMVGNMPPSLSFGSPTASTLGGTISVMANVTSSEKVKEVVLRVDGNVVSSIKSAPYSWSVNTNQFVKGAHMLNLTATNVFGLSSYVEMSVIVDNSAPAVLITAPSDNSTVFGNASVSVSVLGPNPISKVSMTADGKAMGDMTASPYLWSIDTRALTEGVHNLTVTATDANGKSNSSYLRLTVNNSAPTVRIDAPSEGNVSGTVQVSAGVDSLQPIMEATLFLDGNKVSGLNATPYVWQWDSTNATVGKHVLQVSATDQSGNTGNGSVTVWVQPSAVTIDLTLPATGSGMIELAPTIGGAAISHVIYRLDGNVTGNVSGAPFTFALDSTLFRDGLHRLNVTAVTASGLKWFKEFTLEIVNGISGNQDGGTEIDLHLGAVDLLIIQALSVITILGIALKFGHKAKGPKGQGARKECRKPVECDISDPQADKDEK